MVILKQISPVFQHGFKHIPVDRIGRRRLADIFFTPL
jgi:hypothetical protein